MCADITFGADMHYHYYYYHLGYVRMHVTYVRIRIKLLLNRWILSQIYVNPGK